MPHPVDALELRLRLQPIHEIADCRPLDIGFDALGWSAVAQIDAERGIVAADALQIPLQQPYGRQAHLEQREADARGATVDREHTWHGIYLRVGQKPAGAHARPAGVGIQ